MSKYKFFGEMFIEEPHSWGLRGDPYLWRAMRSYLSETPMPTSEKDIESVINQAFAALTGELIIKNETYRVEKFAHGGMSSGGIDCQFWLDKAIPMIKKRFADR